MARRRPPQFPQLRPYSGLGVATPGPFRYNNPAEIPYLPALGSRICPRSVPNLSQVLRKNWGYLDVFRRF